MPGQFQGAQSKTILLIEGHPSIRIVMHNVLKAHGHAVKVHATGEEGIRTVLEYTYDMVICNQNLSGISGLDFFAQMQPYLAQSTTVLTAAFADDYIVNKAQELGINVFMEKPFKIDNLMRYTRSDDGGPMVDFNTKHIYVTNHGKIIPVCSSETNPLPVEKNSLKPFPGKPVKRKRRKRMAYQIRHKFSAIPGRGSRIL
ncbi:MAG: response regulator [Desulfobacteraceae bacterium]|jgi:response regulator RpfG family c-di-GMP phosphodiesterase